MVFVGKGSAQAQIEEFKIKQIKAKDSFFIRAIERNESIPLDMQSLLLI
jgi:hypothetical protein